MHRGHAAIGLPDVANPGIRGKISFSEDLYAADLISVDTSGLGTGIFHTVLRTRVFLSRLFAAQFETELWAVMRSL
jgi:hypothetical protein